MNVNLVLITDIEINARHNLLLQTIGVLQMEIEAYQTVSLFFILIPVIILLSILQLGFFTLYNGRFHPMSTILNAATTNDKEAGEYIKCKYRTRAIISRGLYIFYTISKDHFFVFTEFFFRKFCPYVWLVFKSGL